MALTKLQKKIVVTLLDGGVMRRHMRPNETICWRLLDSGYKPLRNLPEATVNKLFNRLYIQRTDEGVKPCKWVRRTTSGRVYNNSINQSINITS